MDQQEDVQLHTSAAKGETATTGREKKTVLSDSDIFARLDRKSKARAQQRAVRPL